MMIIERGKKISGFLGQLRTSLKRWFNPPVLLELDFETKFPYKFWVSNWSRDAEYPVGFRYKLLSATHKEDADTQLIIIVEKPSNKKTILLNVLYSTDKFDLVAKKFIEDLAATHQLTFEEYDFSNTKTLRDFSEMTKKLGWQSW